MSPWLSSSGVAKQQESLRCPTRWILVPFNGARKVRCLNAICCSFILYNDHELWITYNVRSFLLGLAWTAMGGEIMFVEATRMGGEGKITLTGQLGGSITSWLFYLSSNWTPERPCNSKPRLQLESRPVGQTSSPWTTSITVNTSLDSINCLSLGDVMKESAQLALSWLRSRSVEVNSPCFTLTVDKRWQ